MSIQTIIAKIGVNPKFIAFNAHCWFAYAGVFTSGHKWTAILAIILAGAKEFYFDATYEVPAQTFLDNLTDFAGYCTGIALAVAALDLTALFA